MNTQNTQNCMNFYNDFLCFFNYGDWLLVLDKYAWKQTFCDIILFLTGNFPFLIHWLKRGYLRSTAGKAGIYLKKVALDLVKARREAGHTGKV